MTAQPLISLTDVRKVYPGGTTQPALAGVTLTIPSGQFVAIMGSSGSGKSTLLNLIGGLDRPSSGQVLVANINISSLNETALARFRRQRLGFVFQFFNLLNQLTVLDNVLLPAQLAGLKMAAARSHAHELLAELGIADKAREYPARLSGGQRQRVAIARALINSPAVILADEPTGALDSRSGSAVMDLLTQLHQRGQTVVMVTHDTRLAASYAERIISLRDGQVVDDTQMQSAGSQQPADLMRLRNEGVQS